MLSAAFIPTTATTDRTLLATTRLTAPAVALLPGSAPPAPMPTPTTLIAPTSPGSAPIFPQPVAPTNGQCPQGFTLKSFSACRTPTVLDPLPGGACPAGYLPEQQPSPTGQGGVLCRRRVVTDINTPEYQRCLWGGMGGSPRACALAEMTAFDQAEAAPPPPNGYVPTPAPQAPAEKPVYKKPWFWAAVGGGVVVLGGAAYALTR